MSQVKCCLSYRVIVIRDVVLLTQITARLARLRDEELVESRTDYK